MLPSLALAIYYHWPCSGLVLSRWHSPPPHNPTPTPPTTTTPTTTNTNTTSVLSNELDENIIIFYYHSSKWHYHFSEMPDCLLKIVCAHFSIHCHKETDAVVMSWGDFRFTLVVWSMKILTSQGCRPECQLSWQGPQAACNYDVNHSMGPTHTPRQVTSMRHAFSRAERKHNRNDRRDVTSISSYSRKYCILACVCVYKYLANHHMVLQLKRWKLTQSVAENSWFYHFAHCKIYQSLLVCLTLCIIAIQTACTDIPLSGL